MPRFSAYRKNIAALHLELGIPLNYGDTCGIELQVECQHLVETELDVFNRQPLLEGRAYQAWCQMKVAASNEEINLQIISAYRSAEYQKQLLLKKIARGQGLFDILKVNAAPGYSEHHTGQALDIGCDGYEHLSESFEKSNAFTWLTQHANEYRFYLSFPRGNTYGFLYEPWHWKYFKGEK